MFGWEILFLVGFFLGMAFNWWVNKKANESWTKANLCPDCMDLWNKGHTKDGRNSFENPWGNEDDL